MSMDQDRREPDEPITEQEGLIFGGQPIWERNRKRRGFGARKAAPSVAPEPRTFAAERDYDEPMALDQPIDRPMEPEDDDGFVAPIAHSATKRNDRRASSLAPAAIAAAVVTLGVVGAVGWVMTRDNGVPELAPGSPTVSEVAAAPVTPLAPLPAEVAVTTPPPAPPAAASPRAETRVAAARPAPRTRPAAAASSASESGIDASTTAVLPGGPQPYSTLNPGAPPAPVTPPVNEAAPPPVEAPAAIPATPPPLPTQPDPATQDPTPPQETRPPTS